MSGGEGEKDAAPVAGVLGWPISQSKSPLIHGHWLRALGLLGHYVPLAVAPQDIGRAIEGLRALGFRGANVTIPHKEAVGRHLDGIDDLARRIGAVNTIFRAGERLLGTNTDGFGFLENLSASGGLALDRPALILGAGGASRAVIVALVDAGLPELRLTNRSPDRAEGVAAEIGDPRLITLPWEAREEAAADVGLIVNTTSLGMVGSPPLPFAFHAIDGSRPPVVTDLVYNPLQTSFLREAARAGCKTVDGLGMLLHQARPGFKLWFGQDGTVTPALREEVEQSLGDGR